MTLNTLLLHHFRNYKEALIPFSPKINAIHGANAQGKTNLLEAVYFLVTGRSFRTHHLCDSIFFGAPGFYLEAHFVKNGIEQTLKISCDGVQRKILHNATQLPSLSSLLGILPGVILTPEDIALIDGEPKIRRQFIDLQIAQANPLYLHHLSRYYKAMKQRNELLRRKNFATIAVWEKIMAASAAYVISQRHRAIEELRAEAHPLLLSLSKGRDVLELHYKSCFHQAGDAEHYLLGQFEKLREKEAEQKTTLTGPHKEDLLLLINGKEARFFASEGQKRSCTTALRFAEWKRLKTLTEESPLFCIDDVGTAHDQERKTLLYEQFSELGQVFLTSPELHFPFHSHALLIENGKVFSHSETR